MRCSHRFLNVFFVRTHWALGLVLALMACQSTAAPDWGRLDEELKTTGIEGFIHGASESTSTFAFKIQHSNTLFDFTIVSLVGSDSVHLSQLAQVNRHDRVRVWGQFLPIRNPQKHIEVRKFEVVRKWGPASGPMEKYDYAAKLPEDLVGQSEAEFLVHAVGSEGRIVVLEYKDAIVPLPVRRPELTKDLFRNDRIRIQYRIKTEPGRPTHIVLNEDVENPIVVVERIKELHGKAADLRGRLVKFPKSPEISRDVFALHTPLSDGSSRQFTLVNFESREVFDEITKKLSAAWDQNPDHLNGRNKLLSRVLEVRAKGQFNVVDPNQANVQILLKSADDVEISIVKP